MCILEFFWTVSCNSYNLICLSQLNLARTMSCSLYSVGSGSWVTDGISTTDNTTKVGNVTSVHCLSTHLTSFAVLVDVAGGLQVCAGCRNMAECSYSWLCFLVGYTRSGAQSLADCFIHWMCNFNNLPYYCCGVLYIARVRLRKATKIIYKYRYWCVYSYWQKVVPWFGIYELLIWSLQKKALPCCPYVCSPESGHLFVAGLSHIYGWHWDCHSQHCKYWRYVNIHSIYVKLT